MTAPTVTFLAPPSFDDTTTRPDTPRRRGGLRMTRGARAAASGMKIADADIRRCIDEPDDAVPDPNTPSRTRFRRGDLMVIAGADGMVLRVNRTGPDRDTRPGGTSRPAKRRRRRPA
jgi:hypothetical protein